MSCPLNRNRFRGSGYQKNGSGRGSGSGSSSGGIGDTPATEAAREIQTRLNALLATRDAQDAGKFPPLPAPPPLQTVAPEVRPLSLSPRVFERIRSVAGSCLTTAQTPEDVRILRQMAGCGGRTSRQEIQTWLAALGRCETVVDFRLLPSIGIVQEDLLGILKITA